MQINKNDHELLNFYFNNEILKWDKLKQQILSDKSPFDKKGTIELMVRAECNQTCEYCYIYKYGKQIYPKETRCGKEGIIKNLKSLLDYMYKNQQYQPRWEMFAGDMFYDDLWFDIMDVFFEYFMKIQKTVPDWRTIMAQYNTYYNEHLPSITLPCNMSFVLNDAKAQRVSEYIDKFRKYLDMTIGFSYSSDGFYATDTRERKQMTQEQYDKIFTFCKKHRVGVHPMIAACNIDNWIENYDWWKEQFKRYFSDRKFYMPAMLEVRNGDEWTDEKVEAYLKLLNHIIEDRWKESNCDIAAFSAYLFCDSSEYKDEHGYLNSDCIIDPAMMRIIPSSENCKTCSLGFATCISLYNLALHPCHRLGYPYFSGGHFETDENGVITKLLADEGLDAFWNLSLHNSYMGIRCTSCIYNPLCVKGCLGAQYEWSKDPLLPIDNVCNFLQRKIDFLFKKYEELGVFDYIEAHPKEIPWKRAVFQLLPQIRATLKKEGRI